MIEINKEEDYRFYKECFFIVFGLSFVVYSFYIFLFLLGNHDFSRIKYGTKIFEGVWEGRWSQFVFPKIFLENQLLPIVNAFFAIGFLSLATVLIAKLWDLSKNKLVVCIFCLLITLNPYVLSHLYYVFIIFSVFLWHLFAVLGLLLLLDKHKSKLKIMTACLLWIFALGGYAPVLQLILTLIIASIYVDFVIKDFSIRMIINRYKIVIIAFILSTLTHLLFIKLAMHYGMIEHFMYNIQHLPINEIIVKVFNYPLKPIDVLLKNIPFVAFEEVFIKSLLFILFIFLILTNKNKRFMALLLIVMLLYAMLCSAYISSHNIFDMYRINLFSVPYVIAFLVLVMLANKKIFAKNIVFIASLILIFMYINANFMVQKVWFLGNKYDETVIDRVRTDLFKKIDFNKKYRLYIIGNLYGRQRFANQIKSYRFNDKEKYREFYTYSYYLDPFFTDSLFLYEKKNPIYGVSVYLPSTLFLANNNVDLDKNEKEYASYFSKIIPQNKNEILYWLNDADKDNIFIYGNDIFLFLNENINQYYAIKNYLLNKN